MQPELTFLPIPKQLTVQQGTFGLPREGYLVLESSDPQALWPTAQRLNDALRAQLGIHWAVVACAVPDQGCLTLSDRGVKGLPAQGYCLTVTPDGITLQGGDAAGAFYGVVTLIQLIAQCGNQLPCLHITDWPDFSARGVMLDISRDKVYSMETLLDLIDQLASWKVNQVQLYTEHTFAYPSHREVWTEASPMSGEEVMRLDQACRERQIELVANQNSFGHMARWLKHPRYAHLAEVDGPFEVPWGMMHGPFSLAPSEPGTLPFVFGLYDELLPHFTSGMVNVGCDETFDLGYGRSKAACDARGVGVVYLEYVLALYKELSARGKTVQFWGDIIIQHPELVPQLPTDMISLEWGYEADHPFDAHGQAFAASHIPFYVCPGTSAWNSIAGRTDNCLENLRNAASNGLKNGAVGYLNTDWGDNGHWQTLPISYLGFAMGAAYAWNGAAAPGMDVSMALSRFAFDDPRGVTGKVAYELGNVYRHAGYEPGNASALFGMWEMSLKNIADHPMVQREALLKCLAVIDQASEGISQGGMRRPDAALVQDEFRLAAQMLRHACQRGLFALGAPERLTSTALRGDLQRIIGEYERIWGLRNRPGGLRDSTARFYELLADYPAF